MSEVATSLVYLFLAGAMVAAGWKTAVFLLEWLFGMESKALVEIHVQKAELKAYD